MTDENWRVFNENNEAFERMKLELLKTHSGKFALIEDKQFVKTEPIPDTPENVAGLLFSIRPDGKKV